MSDSIKPACIANYNNIEINTNEGSVVTSGWGSTVECSKESPCKYPNLLQGTEMFLLSRSLCNEHITEEREEMKEKFESEDLVTDAMICANDNSRICAGDSGG